MGRARWTCSVEHFSFFSLDIDRGRGLERAFASHVQVFDNHRRRFPDRADRKGDAGRPDGVFAFCLVGEQVAVKVLQRKNPLVWTLNNRQAVALFDNLNVPKEFVGVGSEVRAICQCGRR